MSTETATTPEEVKTAFTELMEIASAGQPYAHNQVFRSKPECTDIVGKGYDFVRQFQAETLTIDGTKAAIDVTAELRVLALTIDDTDELDEPALFLRTWLKWQSDNTEHTSYACYTISGDNVRLLMEKAANYAAIKEQNQREVEDFDNSLKNMGDDEAAIAAFDFMESGFAEAAIAAVPFKADWQNHPFSESDEQIIEYDLGDGALLPVDAHGFTVMTAKEREPKLLCMLSPLDLGEVEINELPDLLAWITGQPEITSK